MNDKKKGLLFVLSGFSGAGKGTIMNRFFLRYAGFALSVSATTRQPREGEEHGVHYFFISRDTFESWIREGALIEYTEYQGNYYGTPRHFVEENLEQGTDVFLEIEVDGAGKIRKLFPDAVLVFVTPPAPDVLESRLRGRGTNTDEEIRGRLARALEEADFIDDYDYLLINDDLDEAVSMLYAITCAEHHRQMRMRSFDESFKEQLAERLGS